MTKLTPDYFVHYHTKGLVSTLQDSQSYLRKRMWSVLKDFSVGFVTLGMLLFLTCVPFSTWKYKKVLGWLWESCIMCVSFECLASHENMVCNLGLVLATMVPQ